MTIPGRDGETYPPPTTIDGSRVTPMGNPLDYSGETWVTLVPGDDDDRIWEWSLTTGRLILVDS